jgi:hypothetical protein
MSDRIEDSSMTMGVGDGSGRLFIHGDYESIKAAQRISINLGAANALLLDVINGSSSLPPQLRSRIVKYLEGCA